MSDLLPETGSLVQGLTSAEVLKQRVVFGWNVIRQRRRTTVPSLIFSQFRSFLVFLLFAASLISFFVGDFVEGLFILLIVFLNAALGFYQEYKAEAAIEALKALVAEKVRVIRDGVEQVVESKELVCDDVVVLSEGDKIPADGFLTFAVGLEVNEASLTGESALIFKEADNQDKSTVFMGTVVVKGHGVMKVTAIGSRTKFGAVAETLVSMNEEQTPLQKQLAKLGRDLGVVTLLVCALVFAIGTYSGQPFVSMLLTSISLAVAAVPEGLPAVVTITLALGVQRMAKKRAIVRRLSSIETLGAASVICSDKTGTMTKNEMVVRKAWIDGSFQDITPEHALGSTFERILSISVLCTTAKLLRRTDGNGFDILGDRTEGALLVMADQLRFDERALKLRGSLLDEYPFDQERRLMSILWKEDGKFFVFTKGSPESLLSRCTHFLANGETSVLTEPMKGDIFGVIDESARKRLRLIAFGYKEISDPGHEYEREAAESNLIFAGFVGMEDGPREGVAEAIQAAYRSGVAVVMLTGDHELTASSIAREIGLVDGESVDVMTGRQMNDITDEELDRAITRVRVFARIAPHHKLRIVQAFQRRGFIVAVTGDGVNDALALKQADVGVAMGITGTDVAKESADIVVADDNFVTIVRAIAEGRLIYRNLVKVVKYLLATNVSEILTIFFAIVAMLPSPLTPLQILWVNLVTDGFPALALASDVPEKDVMRQGPRRKNEDILNSGNLNFILIVGLAGGIICFAAFFIGYYYWSEYVGRIFVFNAIVLTQIIQIGFVRRTFNYYSNKFLFVTILVTILLQTLILVVPALRNIFYSVYLR